MNLRFWEWFTDVEAYVLYKRKYNHKFKLVCIDGSYFLHYVQRIRPPYQPPKAKVLIGKDLESAKLYYIGHCKAAETQWSKYNKGKQ